MKESSIRRLLAGSVDRGEIPGAVFAYGTDRGVVEKGAVGFRMIRPEKKPMEVDTLFDLASVTKCVATTSAVMILVEEGQLRLDDEVERFIPEFCGTDKEGITIRELLTHTSGMAAWTDLYMHASSPKEIIKAISKFPLEYKTGTAVIYSCLGFIVLGLAVEKVAGEPMDRFLAERVFGPLGMKDTCFNPPPDLRERAAATEYCKWRGRILIGEVHDENAWAMGGVSGNAGLFSIVEDLSRFARMLLNKGTLEGVSVFSPRTVEAMTCDRTGAGFDEKRGLGWLIRGTGVKSSSGDLMSPKAFGHTGFTGTSIWIDPELDIFAILLTNRVHFGRDNNAHIRLRPRFHNAVVSMLC
ncbi:MAG: beta-lactamase family protein [Firmicutes bacterium]|nr:beta-lactamase family protein [Bacillota bacterium]HXL03945.1 serine hydrolase domain-containing protein [Bacillota bacterium]